MKATKIVPPLAKPDIPYAARLAMNEMDRCAQDAEEKIELFTKAIKGMLDAESLDKRTVIGLLELIDLHAFDAMNSINCLAEDFDAQYRDDEGPFPEIEPPEGIDRRGGSRRKPTPEVSHHG
jgi:hypothetical protein